MATTLLVSSIVPDSNGLTWVATDSGMVTTFFAPQLHGDGGHAAGDAWEVDAAPQLRPFCMARTPALSTTAAALVGITLWDRATWGGFAHDIAEVFATPLFTVRITYDDAQGARHVQQAQAYLTAEHTLHRVTEGGADDTVYYVAVAPLDFQMAHINLDLADAACNLRVEICDMTAGTQVAVHAVQVHVAIKSAEP